jgi:hypothetical protein
MLKMTSARAEAFRRPCLASPCSYFQIIKRVTAQKGIAGTLDGFFPWGAMQAVAKGSVFSWGQAQSAKMLHGTAGLTKEQKTVISGGAGGFVQGVVMSPLLLLKTRVMTDPVFRTTGGIMATAIASAKVRVQNRTKKLSTQRTVKQHLTFAFVSFHAGWWPHRHHRGPFSIDEGCGRVLTEARR